MRERMSHRLLQGHGEPKCIEAAWKRVPDKGLTRKNPKMMTWCVPLHLFLASTMAGKQRSIARRL